MKGLNELNAFANSLDRYASNFKDIAGSALNEVGEEYTELLKDYSPVDTGELEENWEGIQNSWDEYVSQNTTPHAIPVNNGHVTPGGGFVPAEHMVEQAMWDIEDKMSDKAKELISWKVIENY